MRCRRALPAALAAVALTAFGCAARSNSAVPPQDVRMDSEVLEEFSEEIVAYVKLHRKLTEKIPIAQSTWSAEQIADRQRRLTAAIRDARREKKQGNIFKPEVAAAFRNVLTRELTGPKGQAMLNEIHSGNPKTEGVPQQRDPRSEPMKTVPLQVNLSLIHISEPTRPY